MTATQEKTASKKRKRRGLAGWLTSFSGILASVATIVAAAASVVAAHQTNRVNQLTIVVRQQTLQLKQAHAQSSGSSGSSGQGVTSGSTGGALPLGGVYLSAKQPTVNNTDLGTGPQVISAQNYPNSNTFYCYGQQGNDQPDVAFDVAGHSVFKAVVGIPDNATNATSLDETVIFANQAGVQLVNPVVVSLGHPATVQLNISNVTQLEVTCTGINTQTQQQDNSNILTLGNAFIS